MKFPSLSISLLKDAFIQSARRFPMALFFSFGFAFIAIYLIEMSEIGSHPSLQRLMFSLATGLPLFTGLQLIAENYIQNKLRKYGLYVAGLLFLVLIYIFIAPDFDGKHLQRPIRFFSFFLMSHLLISLAAYFKNKNLNDFWEFNKELLISWCIGAFYAMVIYTGLTFALLAVDNLFDVQLKPERYAQIFILMYAVFHPVYLLSNFPKTLYPEGQTGNYTSAIKNLVFYILIPLTFLYFFILYAYGLKIVISWELPKGWVSSLVLGFSGIGMITYLLNFQLPLRDGNKLSILFKKYFFIILAPLVLLLFAAIFRRLSDYGFTPPRYFVFITGIWLFLVCLYFLISKSDNIRWIPASLIFFLLLGTLSPFDAFQVSSRSQLNRLISLFEKNQMLQEGKIISKPDSLSLEDKESAISSINTLSELGDLQKLSNLLVQPIQVDTIVHYNAAAFISSKIGLEEASVSKIRLDHIYLSSDDQSDYPVTGFDRVFLIREPERSDDQIELRNNAKNTLEISGSINDTIELNELFYSLDKTYRETHSSTIPSEPFDVSTRLYKHSLYIKRINYSKTASGLQVDQFNAILLSAKK